VVRWQSYSEQERLWPDQGRHILAHFDTEHIIVYQAYSHEIADYAASQQKFGGLWSFDRVSWIKTSFLWMMHRSAWGTKPNQERILAIRLPLVAFDALLAQAVETSHHPLVTGWSREEWGKRMRRAEVRFQWDPDYHWSGVRLERRAVQIGLRGNALRQYATNWITRIEDLTDAVHQVRNTYDAMRTPIERLYRPSVELCTWLRLS
jgi:hypothetical protein